MVKKKKKAAKSKSIKRKIIKKAPAKKKKVIKKKVTPKIPKIPKNTTIGKITHYFPKVRAAVVKLKLPVSAGDPIKIKGHTTDFQQIITSMEIDHVPVNQAKKGAEIGLQVDSRVRSGDVVYKQQ
ncbi:MAG: translation elongation factor-like protein [Candidatus Omnitrophica bacterium]|nr:translation elongation factor-like protein [Candidatus Omnitrophota bacterium]